MAEGFHVNEKSKWRKIKIDTTQVDDFEGFCGIEELTDYELVEDKKKGKRCRSENTGDEAASKSKKPKTVDKEAESIKPLKKKKKKKPTKKKTHLEVGTLPLEDQQTPEIHETDDYSAWDNMFVPEPVMQALRGLKYNSPTTIQTLSLPSAIRDRLDIVAAAETGSGKTLAFGIPLIHHILRLKTEDADSISEENSNGEDSKLKNTKLFALVLTPTRELAIQVKNHLKAASKFTGILVMAIVGGMASEKQERLLRKCPEIIVATPGRLWELIQEGNPYMSTVTDIRFLVVDEADRMLETGHFVEFSNLLEQLNSDEEKRKRRQTFVFSATLSMVHDTPNRLWLKKKKKKLTQTEKIQSLIDIIGVSERPKILDITRKFGTVESLQEMRINCQNTEKDFYLYYILTNHPGRTLIFCNSIDCVRRISHIFEHLKKQVLCLHASMHQKQRLKNLERFAANENSLLVATDVAARGLDIPNIQHVVHYQVPTTSETYVHRSGRTARANRTGLSVMLLDPEEMKRYHNICRTLNRDESLAEFPVDANLFKRLQKPVLLARKLDEKSHRWRKLNSENNWFQKAARDMDLELDDDNLINDMGDSYEKSQQQKELKVLRKQLDVLLSKPLYPQQFSKKYPVVPGFLKSIEQQGKITTKN